MNIGAIRFTVDGNFANVQGKTAVAGWDADFGSIQAIPSPSALLGGLVLLGSMLLGRSRLSSQSQRMIA